MTNPVNSILKEAGKLSHSELFELHKAIGAMLGMRGQSATSTVESVRPNAVHSDERWLLDVIVEAMHSVGDGVTYAQLASSRHKAAFRSKVPNLIQYLEGVSPEKKVQRAVLRLGVKLLYESLCQWNWRGPITAHTVLDNMHRLPAVIDRAFPGYFSAGILAFIFRKPDNASPANRRFTR